MTVDISKLAMALKGASVDMVKAVLVLRIDRKPAKDARIGT